MIACSLAIFPAAEMKKPKTCRKSKVRLLETQATMDWVDSGHSLIFKSRIQSILVP